MAELKDSGVRRDFGTGAVRDCAEGKGRCDLLPLRLIAERLNDKIFAYIEEYIRNGESRSIWGAIDWYMHLTFKQPCEVFLDVAKQYEDGARKYADRNWENGIPLHCFIDSGVRHYLKYLRGDTDEPHGRAFIWNMLGALWTQENHPELIDLPFAEGKK